MMERNQSSAVILAIFLFCAGVAAGALAHRYYAATVVVANGPSENVRTHYVKDLTARLNLTSKQVDRLEDILDETKSQFRSAHETCRPAIAKVKEEQISDIKSILTPSQLPKYNQLLAERERRAKQQEAHERQAEEREAAARKTRPH